MKLRIKADPSYDVVLDSRYVRWPRPTIRMYVRQWDRRIERECRLRPGLNVWTLRDLTTPLPRIAQRVIRNIPF